MNHSVSSSSLTVICKNTKRIKKGEQVSNELGKCICSTFFQRKNLTGILFMVISWEFAQGPGGPVCFL